MLVQIFKRHLHHAARWRHICLRIRSQFDFFLKIRRAQFVRTTLTIYEKDRNKFS